MARRLRGAAVVCALAVALAACAVGETRAASEVTDTRARLRGLVRSTTTGPTDYWFEYGPTTGYGATTGIGSVDVENTTEPREVSDTVDGLEEGTEYHYRLCAESADGLGICGEDRTFTTTEAQDSVVGEGRLAYTPSHFDFELGLIVDARSDPSGGGPSGEVRTWVRLGPTIGGTQGTVTCLLVAGDRAAIGYQDTATSGFLSIFIGSGGSQVAFGPQLPPGGTECPDPATAQFVAFPISLGFPPIMVGPNVASGGFALHDHPSPG